MIYQINKVGYIIFNGKNVIKNEKTIIIKQADSYHKIENAFFK